MKNSLRIIKKMALVVLPIFLIHFLVFKFTSLVLEYKEYYYSLPFLYILYFTLSTISIVVIKRISEKNFDITGMSFLVTSSIKLILSYIIVSPILNSETAFVSEKRNFFFIFIIFLVIDTLFTARILNKKQ